MLAMSDVTLYIIIAARRIIAAERRDPQNL